MRNLWLIITCITLQNSGIFAQTIEYPKLRNEVTIDTFHNIYVVEDYYRNLEDPLNITTLRWVDEQNKLADKVLNRANARNHTFNLIDEYSYIRSKIPQKKGEFYFYYGTYGALSVPALYQSSSLNQNPDLLLDPNFISRTDNILLRDYQVSKNSKYLAYKFSRNGSDWSEIKVLSIASGMHTTDHLNNVKYSALAWKDDGFFYSTFDRGDKFDAATGQKVYYHKINTNQSDDSLIFKRTSSSFSFNFKTTTSERFFILTEIYQETDKANVYFIDYQSPNPTLQPLIRKFGDNLNVLDEHKGKFIALTNLNANNGSIVEIDPYNPTKWRTIIPEYSNAVLLYARAMDEKIVAVFQSNQQPILAVYDYQGNSLFSKKFPFGTALRGFNGLPGDKELVYSYNSYTLPSVGYTFNLNDYTSKVIKLTEVSYTYTDIIYEETSYTSKDGITIPMLLIYKEGMVRNGTNPTILKTYGGFGAVSTPNFDPGIVYFVRKGGVFAYANVRGGGDYGRDWRDQGRALNKQTSFDDFIAGAKFLISSGITSPDKLAATGASNGGLVVAASAIQHPELFKVVVPEVAPLDMLRFEKFTVGHFHIDEYGSINNRKEFENLYAYSPLHNIKNNINYPAMLVITSKEDDRVPPSHSYKFVARLQNTPYQKNLILLRTENNAGHGGAPNLYGYVKQTADKYAFIMEMINNTKQTYSIK